MVLALVALAAIGSAAWHAISQPGPNRWLTLIRRYGIGLCALTVATVAAALAAVLAPRAAASAVLLLAATITAVSALTGGSLRSGARRIVLRAQWPSVARACSLAVTKDRRPQEWPAETVLQGLNTNIVESLPILSRGRGFPGGCSWRVTPARGSTIDAIANASEALAAAWRVGLVEVERHTASRGTLTVTWKV